MEGVVSLLLGSRKSQVTSEKWGAQRVAARLPRYLTHQHTENMVKFA